MVICAIYNADVLQGLEKVIPDAPKNETPVHLRNWQIYANHKKVLKSDESDVGIDKSGKPIPGRVPEPATPNVEAKKPFMTPTTAPR